MLFLSRARLLRPFLVLLCLSSAVAQDGKGKKPKDDESDVKKQPLPRHSFSTPLEYQTLLDDWMLSGASLFERNNLMLHPGVPNLAGFAFNKQAVRTADWSANLEFRVKGPEDQRIPHDQTFVFWYVQENISAVYDESLAIKAETWRKGLDTQGMTFGGSKARFKGFGIVFSVASDPHVAIVTNDGTKDMDLARDLAAAKRTSFEFRNTEKPMQVKIRVKKGKVELFKGEQKLVEVDGVETKAGGFMGLTAWSGSGKEPPSFVAVTGMQVVSFDDTVMAEEMKDVSTQIQDAYKEMLLDEKRHFVDQKAQSDHINRLIGMIEDNIRVDLPKEASLVSEMQRLTEKLDGLGTDCGMVVQESRILLEQNAGSADAVPATHEEHVQAMKDMVMSIRKTIKMHHVESKMEMTKIEKNLGEVKERNAGSNGGKHMNRIQQQSKTLEMTVNTRSSTMNWMFFCMIAAVLAVGALMYNRMSYYEKKHFL